MLQSPGLSTQNALHEPPVFLHRPLTWQAYSPASGRAVGRSAGTGLAHRARGLDSTQLHNDADTAASHLRQRAEEAPVKRRTRKLQSPADAGCDARILF